MYGMGVGVEGEGMLDVLTCHVGYSDDNTAIARLR